MITALTFIVVGLAAALIVYTAWACWSVGRRLGALAADTSDPAVLHRVPPPDRGGVSAASVRAEKRADDSREAFAECLEDGWQHGEEYE